MLLNLVELYKRFHLDDKNLKPSDSWHNKNFRRWLRDGTPEPRIYPDVWHDIKYKGYLKPEEVVYKRFLWKQRRMAIASGINKNGEMVWDLYTVLPKRLERARRDASAWNLVEAIDGKMNTSDFLHNNLEVAILGNSVGSNIAEVLCTIGVDHFLLADADIQDGVGRGRVADPRADNDGKKKVHKVRDQILKMSPYAECNCFPVQITEENIDQILKGTMSKNPGRMLIIIEEIDDPIVKDIIRKWAHNNETLVISVADIGMSAAKMVVEEAKDLPYADLPAKYSKDEYGKDAPNLLAKILIDYGLDELPLEMVNGINRMMKGEIKSFPQSGIASRLAGLLVAQAILSHIRGGLVTKVLQLDLSKFVDIKWKDDNFMQIVRIANQELRDKLGIKEQVKKA